MLLALVLLGVGGCNSESSGDVSEPFNRNPIDFSPKAEEVLRSSLEKITMDADMEPCLIPHLIVDHAAQEKLNQELQKGRDFSEVADELQRDFTPSYDRIGFGIAGYPIGKRSVEWRHTLLGFSVSISPACIELLAGRKLDIDEAGNLVAVQPPPAELAKAILEKPRQ